MGSTTEDVGVVLHRLCLMLNLHREYRRDDRKTYLQSRELPDDLISSPIYTWCILRSYGMLDLDVTVNGLRVSVGGVKCCMFTLCMLFPGVLYSLQTRRCFAGGAVDATLPKAGAVSWQGFGAHKISHILWTILSNVVEEVPLPFVFLGVLQTQLPSVCPQAEMLASA